MQDRKFSVIVPLYKGNYETLDRFLFHLKEQDYRNFEVIVSYNSPTLTLTKSRALRILDKEKKWLTWKEVDAGYDKALGTGNHCAAFNAGAAIAEGDYLLFLDPDIMLLPGTLREYKDAFDANPDVDFVYGDYDFSMGAGRIQGRRYNEYELRCANYVSGAFPIKRSAFRGWDPAVKSLQDWDMWYSAIDAGAKGLYVQRPFFEAQAPQEKGISAEGAEQWKERYAFVREKHGFPVSETVFTSLGAPDHATNAAEILGVDTRVFNNVHIFKPHDYRNVCLIGFYSQSPDPADPMMAVRQHLGLFYDGGDLKKDMVPGKKVIHWVGTDIFMLQHKTSWMGVQFIAKMLSDPDMGIVHLTESAHTHDELAELGIESRIVPLPPKRLFEPMPLPEEFAVGVYVNPTQDMYYEEFMYEVADAMPDVKFKFFGNRNMKRTKANKEWVGWVDMAEFLPTVSALARLTRHDGLPLGPLEAMMAGRNVLCSVPLKHALHIEVKDGDPDLAGTVAGIRSLQKMPLNKKGSAHWRQELSHDRYRETMKGLLA